MLLLLLSFAVTNPQPAPTATPTKSATALADKPICRSFPETGSLVRMTKVCKTKREWDADRAALRGGPGVDSCRNAANGGGC